MDPKAKGREWELVDRRGKVVINLSVIATILTVFMITSTLYSKFVFIGEFGPEFRTITQKVQSKVCACCPCIKKRKYRL